MICVVPLAGPDFVRPDGGLKPLTAVDGQPLLRRALDSRSWRRDGGLKDDGLVFVLRDTDASRGFVVEHLSAWYPAAQTVYLSAFTAGAALSALAGIAPVAHRAAPVCVDLVDILFDDASKPGDLFAREPRAGGLGLWFDSDNPIYSYFEGAETGRIVRVREKQVISACASTGVYWFRSPSVYLAAVAHSLDHRDALAHNGLIFVAPTLNGVIAAGWDVHAAKVTDVRDIKIEPAAPSMAIGR